MRKNYNYDNGVYTCGITYTLKNGKTVTRFYEADALSVFDEVVEVAKTDEVINQIEPFNIDKKDILFTTLCDENDSERTEKILDVKDYDKLFYDFKSDLQNMSNNDFINVESLDMYGLVYYDYVSDSNNGYITFYTINYNAPDEIIKKIKGMTQEEIKNFYDDYYNSRDHYKSSYSENCPVELYTFDLSNSSNQTLDYIKSMQTAN
ncbi:MAG: hypothetical protein LIO43_02135 [Clostridiales bacterium]|nr:hypothetical protein [Clostridiales bacterium]